MESSPELSTSASEQTSVLDDPIIELKKVMRFSSELHYVELLLWAAHTGMRSILPSEVCLYLGFEGAKSSGKTTATKAAVCLASNGKMVSAISDAALKRLCEENCILGIDEVDAHATKNENLETILRVGNSWDAKAPICIRSRGDWKVFETNIGGPKVFNFRGEVDDALRSRCLVIPMPTVKDADLAINSLFLEQKLEFVRSWLHADVKAHTRDWTKERVQEHMESDEFRQRVKNIDPQLGRGYQQAAILLVVSDIMGWGLDDKIGEIVESQENEDSLETEKEILSNWYLAEREKHKEQVLSNPGLIIQIGSEELRMFLNRDLEEMRIKPVSKQRFSVLKQELGWRKGINEKKSSARRGKNMLFFDQTVLKTLGMGADD